MAPSSSVYAALRSECPERAIQWMSRGLSFHSESHMVVRGQEGKMNMLGSDGGVHPDQGTVRTKARGLKGRGWGGGRTGHGAVSVLAHLWDQKCTRAVKTVTLGEKRN